MTHNLEVFDMSPSYTMVGPWFRWMRAEDDGLEKLYNLETSEGTRYILSNNMACKDRTEFHRLFRAHARAQQLGWCASGVLAFEIVARMP